MVFLWKIKQCEIVENKRSCRFVELKYKNTIEWSKKKILREISYLYHKSSDTSGASTLPKKKNCKKKMDRGDKNSQTNPHTPTYFILSFAATVQSS